MTLLEKLFAAMDGSRGMPALERIVTSVLSALNDREKSARHLAADVVKDAALTQKVLKLANSAMYEPFANEKGSVSGALGILGGDTLLHIVLGTAMVTDDEAEGDKNLSKSMLAAELARSLSAERCEEVSVATLMYDLGRMMSARYLPDEMARVDQRIADGADPDAAAVEVLGMSLQEIGAEIAARWRLPAEIMSIIDGSGDPSLVGIARFSSTAATLIQEGRAEEARKLAAELDVPGTDKSRLSGLIERKAEKAGTVQPQLSAMASDALLADLHASLVKDRKRNVEELAGTIFPAFVGALDTAHCLLFMATKSGDFGVRYAYGKGVDALRSKLRISAEFKPTAFHAAIKNNVDVAIADVSKLNPAALLNDYAALLPGVRKFLILPIAHASVSGLMYCDWETERELTASELAIVRKLRDLFLPFFPR